MGRSVAKLLASKGANVLIVARGLPSLEETIEMISVYVPPRLPPHYLTPHIESSHPLVSTLPLYQRRPHVFHRSRPRPLRSHSVERQPAPRHSLVLRRYLALKPLYRI